MTKEELVAEIAALSESDKQFLMKFIKPTLRKLLDKDELKRCNHLYKMGLIEKGRSSDSHGSVVFYIDSSIRTLL